MLFRLLSRDDGGGNNSVSYRVGEMGGVGEILMGEIGFFGEGGLVIACGG